MRKSERKRFMDIRESGEMYLETILILSAQKERLRSVDIAEHMGYSKPSVSRALGVLKRKGLAQVDQSGFVTLTEAGAVIAKNIYERHLILSKLLRSIGVDEETAMADACKVEHYISETTFEAIKRHMREHGAED